MFLIGRKIHVDSRGASQRKFLQQRYDETRIPFEPIIDELTRTCLRSDPLKRSGQMLHQPSSPEDDVLPVRSKEVLIKGVRREPKILFNGCLPVTSVFWPPVD